MNTFKHPARPHRTPWQSRAYAILFGLGVYAVILAVIVFFAQAFSLAMFEAATWEVVL